MPNELESQIITIADNYIKALINKLKPQSKEWLQVALNRLVFQQSYSAHNYKVVYDNEDSDNALICVDC